MKAEEHPLGQRMSTIVSLGLLDAADKNAEPQIQLEAHALLMATLSGSILGRNP